MLYSDPYRSYKTICRVTLDITVFAPVPLWFQEMSSNGHPNPLYIDVRKSDLDSSKICTRVSTFFCLSYLHCKLHLPFIITCPYISENMASCICALLIQNKQICNLCQDILLMLCNAEVMSLKWPSVSTLKTLTCWTCCTLMLWVVFQKDFTFTLFFKYNVASKSYISNTTTTTPWINTSLFLLTE